MQAWSDRYASEEDLLNNSRYFVLWVLCVGFCLFVCFHLGFLCGFFLLFGGFFVCLFFLVLFFVLRYQITKFEVFVIVLEEDEFEHLLSSST